MRGLLFHFGSLRITSGYWVITFDAWNAVMDQYRDDKMV